MPEEIVFSVDAKLYGQPALDFLGFANQACQAIERVLEDGLTMRAAFTPTSVDELAMTVFAWLSPEANLPPQSGDDQTDILPDTAPETRRKALEEILAEEPDIATRFPLDLWLEHAAFPLNNPVREDTVIVNRRRRWRRKAEDLHDIAHELVLPVLKGFKIDESPAKDILQQSGTWLSRRFGRGRGVDIDAMRQVYQAIADSETPPSLKQAREWGETLRSPGPPNQIKIVLQDKNLTIEKLAEQWPNLRERAKKILRDDPNPIKKGHNPKAEAWMRRIDPSFAYHSRQGEPLHGWWLTVLDLGLRRLLTAVQGQRVQLRRTTEAAAELRDTLAAPWCETLRSLVRTYRTAIGQTDPSRLDDPPHPRVHRGWREVRAGWLAEAPQPEDVERRRAVAKAVAERLSPSDFGHMPFFHALAEPQYATLWTPHDIISEQLTQYTRVYRFQRRLVPPVPHFSEQSPPMLEFGQGRMEARIETGVGGGAVTLALPGNNAVRRLRLPFASRELTARRGRFTQYQNVALGGVKIIPPKRKTAAGPPTRVSPLNPARLCVVCRAPARREPQKWHVRDGMVVAAVDLSQPYLAGVAVWETYTSERLAARPGVTDALRAAIHDPAVQRLELPPEPNRRQGRVARRIAPNDDLQPAWAVLRRTVLIDASPERRITAEEREFLQTLDVPTYRCEPDVKVLDGWEAARAELTRRLAVVRRADYVRANPQTAAERHIQALAHVFQIRTDLPPDQLRAQVVARAVAEAPKLRADFTQQLKRFLELVFPHNQPGTGEKPHHPERRTGGLSLQRLVFFDHLLALLLSAQHVFGRQFYATTIAKLRRRISEISKKRGEYTAAKLRAVLRAEQCDFVVAENFSRVREVGKLPRESNRRLRLQAVRRIQDAITAVARKEGVSIRFQSNYLIGGQSALTGQWGLRARIVPAPVLASLAQRHPWYTPDILKRQGDHLWIEPTGPLFVEPFLAEMGDVKRAAPKTEPGSSLSRRLRMYPATLNMAAMLGLRALAQRDFAPIHAFRYGSARRSPGNPPHTITIVQRRADPTLDGDEPQPDDRRPSARADQLYCLTLGPFPVNAPAPACRNGADLWTWREDESPHAVPQHALNTRLQTEILTRFYGGRTANGNAGGVVQG